MQPSSDIADAVDRLLREGAVQLLFQPIVDLTKRTTFAYEALARPSVDLFRGPLELIRAAIAVGRIGELGQLLRQLAVDGCPGVPLFLNVLPQEFDQPYLVKPTDPIYQHDHLVFLELTESTPLDNFKRCADILVEARGKGIRLAIDDLGSDYSNLNYLADFSPDIVKLDRKLVSGLTIDSNRYSLVQGIVQLCTVVGAKVIAEGIETAEELEAVIEAGAHYGQGYFLGRPVTPPATPAWPLEPKQEASTISKASGRRELLVVTVGHPNRGRWQLPSFRTHYATPFGLERILERQTFDCAAIDTRGWDRQLAAAIETLRVGSSGIMPLCLAFPHTDGQLLGTLLQQPCDGMIDCDWSKQNIDTALLAAMRRVEEGRLLATQDDLTKLYNRRHFDHILDVEHKRSSRYGHAYTLVMIDLDSLRETNTAYGHQAGSALICEAGRLIAEYTRNTDFAFRYGGDEFVIMLVEADLETGLRYTTRLWEAMQEASIVVAAQRVKVRGSFGLASFPLDGETCADVLESADRAVYRAKALGKNRIVTYRQMNNG